MTATLDRPVAPDAMAPARYRIGRTRQDTRDTFTIELEPVDGPMLRYRAGQFTMLDAFGVGEVPISISGDPTRPGPLEHTIRDVGAVTHALIAAPRGAVLGVRGPFGTSWDVADGMGGDVVLVAGGIGLAPLRPALLEIVRHRDRYNRVVLLYGARTPEDILFGDELRSWAHDHGIVVEVTVDNGQHAWRGKVGLVTNLVPRAGFDPHSTLALVCGPEVMMRSAAQALVARGVPGDRVRLSLERSMKCGVGLCGHCQLRDLFVCVDGPVLGYDRLAPLLSVREL
ncbi:FAD/NAD(P)-binding protein [Isoptericola sp. b441]|uniref:FAD/NAD(P)-binding protein n=1 Tax=Actinotalea lenta TaxID=3064654 RepID=A0ABT9DAX6_9CELL|nr:MULTISPECIES: FAD/NAD(P)-binding protein [unclassified Isoptericola]MDO8106451.1 FAD/NAD(P)-binding protein [Isoptericola sp. b441]MDO8121833.1 FAD/NAD(P)-binding protein [Isoptericola sp. b490]